jgi:hypothetical protein
MVNNQNETPEDDSANDIVYLRKAGKQILQNATIQQGSYSDETFTKQIALDNLGKDYEWKRVKDLNFRTPMNYSEKVDSTKIKVFSDSVTANDIHQGALGDCYLLSAMSVLAHSRPGLLKKIFH